jgi:hypothetical protein
MASSPNYARQALLGVILGPVSLLLGVFGLLLPQSIGLLFSIPAFLLATLSLTLALQAVFSPKRPVGLIGATLSCLALATTLFSSAQAIPTMVLATTDQALLQAGETSPANNAVADTTQPPAPPPPPSVPEPTAGTLAHPALIKSIRDGVRQASAEGKLLGLGQIQKAVPYILVSPQGNPPQWAEKWVLTDTTGQKAEITILCQETDSGADWSIDGYHLVQTEPPTSP